jgi:hypothetical protein
MPIATVESLKERTARLKKKLAEKGESLEGPAARLLEKKIRRAQRARRRLEARAARLAGKVKETKG